MDPITINGWTPEVTVELSADDTKVVIAISDGQLDVYAALTAAQATDLRDALDSAITALEDE